MHVNFGYLRDAPDPRDQDHAAGLLKLATAPESFSFKECVREILDQNPLGSCVAHAVPNAILTRLIYQGETDAELSSRLFAYWHSRNQHGDALNDSGTSIRLCIKALNTLGRPPERIWPYVVGKFTEKPPPIVLSHAHDRRPAKYHRIYETEEARIAVVKSIIASGIPVVFGTPVSVGFTRLVGTRLVGPPINETIAGGHAMFICGYDAAGVLVPNSWGKSWGDHGFCRLSWSYITWSETHDLWAIDI